MAQPQPLRRGATLGQPQNAQKSDNPQGQKSLGKQYIKSARGGLKLEEQKVRHGEPPVKTGIHELKETEKTPAGLLGSEGRRKISEGRTMRVGGVHGLAKDYPQTKRPAKGQKNLRNRGAPTEKKG